MPLSPQHQFSPYLLARIGCSCAPGAPPSAACEAVWLCADTFSHNEELVEFLKTDRVWRLLEGRIHSELQR